MELSVVVPQRRNSFPEQLATGVLRGTGGAALFAATLVEPLTARFIFLSFYCFSFLSPVFFHIYSAGNVPGSTTASFLLAVN